MTSSSGANRKTTQQATMSAVWSFSALIDGKLEYPKYPLKIGDKDIFTNNPTEYGYKPIIDTNCPQEDGYYFTPIYTETETEIIQVWEKKEISVQQNVAELKQKLADTDYKALKYAEGWITDEEYAPIRAERQAIRDKINELEINYLSDGGEVTE